MPDTVLIVDDDCAIGAALVVRLEAHGYHVLHVQTGSEGLEAARRLRPGIIVLDIRLPDLDGFEVCRRLRHDPALASTPILFLSANSVGPVREQAIEVGGNAFINKPYDASDLLAAIETLIAGGTVDQSPTENVHVD